MGMVGGHVEGTKSEEQRGKVDADYRRQRGRGAEEERGRNTRGTEDKGRTRA